MFLSVILLWITACVPTFHVTLGSMPDQDPGSKVESGVTTKAQILQLFGQPDFTGVDDDGFPRWTWTHLGVEVVGGRDASITSFFNLEISFDGEKVRSYSYSKKAE